MAFSSSLRPTAKPFIPGQPVNNEVFRFMDLAREVRDQVYHALWENTPVVIIPYIGKKLAVHYGGYDDIASDEGYLPRWLLGNKTMLDEGRDQLLRNARWAFDCKSSCTRPQKISPLLNPSLARDLTIVAELEFRMDTSTNPAAVDVLALKGRHSAPLEILAASSSRSNRLKTLRLYFSFDIPPPYMRRIMHHAMKLDFGDTRFFANMFETVEIVIFNVKHSTHFTEGAICPFVIQAIMDGVPKLGALLVGGGKVEARDTLVGDNWQFRFSRDRTGGN